MDNKTAGIKNILLCIAILLLCVCNAKAQYSNAQAHHADTTVQRTNNEAQCVDSKAPRCNAVPHIGAAISFAPVKALATDEYQRLWLKGKQAYSLNIEMLYSALPTDSNEYAEDYNFPEFALGLQYDFDHGITMHRSPNPAWGMAEMVDYTSRMGNILTLYGSFLRPVVRREKWDAGYALGMGLGYTRTKYNPHNNVDNEMIGSRWLVYFTASIYATWHFAHNFGLRGGMKFFHHSNGALNRPNKGANMIGPYLGVVYEPYHETLARRSKSPHRDFRKYIYTNFTAGIGGKTLNEDWKKTQHHTAPGEPRYRTGRFRLYAAYSLQTDVMFRYARRWATGIGFDMFYATYAKRVEEIDKADGLNLKHNNLSYGIALKHEVFYKKLSASMEIGRYLYRHLGKDDDVTRKEFPFYERIGLRYSFPKLGGMQIGLNVKAHKFKADFSEFTIGLPIVLKKF